MCVLHQWVLTPVPSQQDSAWPFLAGPHRRPAAAHLLGTSMLTTGTPGLSLIWASPEAPPLTAGGWSQGRSQNPGNGIHPCVKPPETHRSPQPPALIGQAVKGLILEEKAHKPSQRGDRLKYSESCFSTTPACPLAHVTSTPHTCKISSPDGKTLGGLMPLQN